MSRRELALANFQRGFNCAQSVLSAFAAEFGMEEGLVMRLAGGFGGGMGRRGDTCGAVSGALMVLGLHFAPIDPEDKQGKEDAYQLARDFMGRFADRYGALRCNDLLGVDINTAEGLQKAREEGKFKQRCPDFVGGAVEILEEFVAGS